LLDEDLATGCSSRVKAAAEAPPSHQLKTAALDEKRRFRQDAWTPLLIAAVTAS
jgi:hypothetical protein